MKRDAAEQVIEPDLTEIYSESGIVVRLKDGKVMTQFNQNERIFPASLTKIMTCIIAIEHIEDLEETVVISPERYNELYVQEASMAGFLPGEEARVIDLLPTPKHLDGFVFQSSMFSLRDDWTLAEGEIKGGKTGYTDQAGLCLATMALVRGDEYIAVTAKADGDHSTEPYHVYDAFALYDLL